MTQPSEKRALRMHPQLLWDVITKQAGTLQKAVLEGVMNSVDAGATRCDVTLTRNSFRISDDGKGFLSMREIEDFFETFGQPHKKGDATYGRFRMGRGQMFAFGANVWRSNEFQMAVDLQPQEESVATDGLGYDLSTMPDSVKGCSIAVDLYRKLLPSEVSSVEREIAKYVAWAPIPVTVNGKVVSKDPASAKWDAETENAYIKYRENGALTVYNLGVLVQEIPGHTFGTGGLVVSKERFDVNFARNSIIDTCPVWRAVRNRIRKDAGVAIKKKPRLSESERQSALVDLLNGEVTPEEVKDLPLFELANGNHISLDSLGDRLSKLRRVAVTPVKDRTGTRVLESKLAMVLSRGTLDVAEVDTALKFLGKVHAVIVANEAKFSRRTYQFDMADKTEMTPAEMRAIIPDDMTELPKAKLSPAEKVSLDILETGVSKVQQMFSAVAAHKKHPSHQWSADALDKMNVNGSIMERLFTRVKAGAGRRDVRVGDSAVAQAWTDGKDNIWFERRMLRLVSEGQKGMARLAMLAVHEFLHDAPDTATHVHDAEFYELFHDICLDTPIVGMAVESMLKRAAAVIENENRKSTGAFRKTPAAIARPLDQIALLSENQLALPAYEAPGAVPAEEPEEAPSPAM